MVKRIRAHTRISFKVLQLIAAYAAPNKLFLTNLPVFRHKTKTKIMRKLFFKSMLLLCALIVGTSSVWGDTTVSYGWEDSDNSDAWTITNTITKTSGQGNTGTYAGKINTNHTYVQFKEKVYVKSFSFAFKRTSTNSNYNVYIETSTDGSEWSAAETYTMGSFTNGSYSTKTKTFDGTKEYYVRFHCYNTTAVRYVDDVSISYSTTPSNPQCTTPSISPNGGSFVESQEITLSCSTDGATIYYTLDGNNPTTSSTVYSTPFSITESKTIKAIAVAENMDNSNVATAEFTKITPLANIAALTYNTGTNDYIVSLQNAVVTYVNGNYAYLQDASGAVVIYKSGHGLTAGDVLNGIATVSYQLRNNNPQITDLSGITPISGSAPSPTCVVQTEWNHNFNDVLSQYFQITGATLTQNNSKYYVSLNGENVQLYKASGSISSLDLEKTYNITGFPTLYNSTKEIQIYVDPEEVVTPTLAITPATAAIFTYVENNGPSDDQIFTITGTHLVSASITANVTSDYEITNASKYNSSVTIASGDQVSIRLKSGLAKGTHNGTLTLSSTDASNVVVNLSGSVTGQTYTINLDDQITGGTIEANTLSAEAGAVVTLAATPDAAYTFSAWTVYEDDLETIVPVENNQFTMPASDVYVTATFTSKPTYAVTCNYDNTKGLLTSDPESAYEGQTVTLSYAEETGYELSSIVITKTSDGSATGITPTASGEDFTFTMPSYAVTVTAAFESSTYDGTFALFSGDLSEGDYVIVYNDGAMNNAVTNNKFGITDVTISNNTIANPERSIVWHIAPSATNGYWTLYNAKVNKYVNGSTSSTNTNLVDDPTSSNGAIWSVIGTYDFRCKANEGQSTTRYLRVNGSVFGNYASSNGGTLTLYKHTTLTPRTITFNGNGGTFNEEATYTQDVYDGVEATLDANQFTRNGYAFTGWNTEESGTGDSYDDQDDITVTGGDLTLYAQWAQLYTLTIDNNIDGGSVSIVGDINSAIEGTEITLSPSPTIGHALNAWNVYKAGDESTKVTVTDNKFNMPAYNIIVSATFEEGTTYTLVNSVDALYDGMHLLIVNEDASNAMGVDNGNNRGFIDLESSINTDEHVITNPTPGCVDIQLESTYYSTTNGWAFNVGGGTDSYLYAASSNSNYLKTGYFATGNADAISTISFSKNDAVITFKGSNTRNIIRYNSTSNIFSCYGSGQQSIQIYKKSYNVASYEINLVQGEWATFCPSVDVEIPDGINAYYATYADNTLTAVLIENGKIKEGEGVLLKATSNAGSYTFNATTGASRIATNKLMGRVEDLVPNTSYFTYYVFTGSRFARYEKTIPANKAYFRVNGAYQASAPSAIRFEEGINNATNINSIDDNDNVAKFFENGQLFIKKNGITYDTLGRIVK